jgi:hypothetical protein
MPNELFDRIAREVLDDETVRRFEWLRMSGPVSRTRLQKPIAHAAIVAILEKHYPPVPEEAEGIIENIINYFVWDGEHADEVREYVRRQFQAYAEQYAATQAKEFLNKLHASNPSKRRRPLQSDIGRPTFDAAKKKEVAK